MQCSALLPRNNGNNIVSSNSQDTSTGDRNFLNTIKKSGDSDHEISCDHKKSCCFVSQFSQKISNFWNFSFFLHRN